MIAAAACATSFASTLAFGGAFSCTVFIGAGDGGARALGFGGGGGGSLSASAAMLAACTPHTRTQTHTMYTPYTVRRLCTKAVSRKCGQCVSRVCPPPLRRPHSQSHRARGPDQQSPSPPPVPPVAHTRAVRLVTVRSMYERSGKSVGHGVSYGRARCEPWSRVPTPPL